MKKNKKLNILFHLIIILLSVSYIILAILLHTNKNESFYIALIPLLLVILSLKAYQIWEEKK